MWYCETADLVSTFGEDEIIELTNRDEISTGAIVQSIVDNAIADATAEINMYLAGRNLLPLESVPEALRRIACDITRFYLYINPNEDAQVSVRYRERIKQLRDVAAGRLSIGLDKAGVQVEPENTILMTGGQNMFSRKGPGLW